MDGGLHGGERDLHGGGAGAVDSPSVQMAGLGGISAAAARVKWGAGVVLAFAIALSRGPRSAFSVDYATSDGSALAGEDCRAASGTLSLEAGSRCGTMSPAA